MTRFAAMFHRVSLRFSCYGIPEFARQSPRSAVGGSAGERTFPERQAAGSGGTISGWPNRLPSSPWCKSGTCSANPLAKDELWSCRALVGPRFLPLQTNTLSGFVSQNPPKNVVNSALGRLSDQEIPFREFFCPANCAASGWPGKSPVSATFDTAVSCPSQLLYEVPSRTRHLSFPSHLTASLRRDPCCVPSAQLLGTPMPKMLRDGHHQMKVMIAAHLGSCG